MTPLVHYGAKPCGPLDYPGAEDDTLVTCPECRRLNGFALQPLTDGTQVYPGHTEIQPGGQQRDYVVLSEAERARGFVRPYRDAYRHARCGRITTMSRAIAETYARDPAFYSGTFCSTCARHFPIGEDGEFTWFEMDGRDGPRVGT